MSVWRDSAREQIARLVADLPEDATLAMRRNALWGKGYHAHLGTSWGRKMWGREVRAYLARHDPEHRAIPAGFVFAADIYFPFREASDA